MGSSAMAGIVSRMRSLVIAVRTRFCKSIKQQPTVEHGGCCDQAKATTRLRVRRRSSMRKSSSGNGHPARTALGDVDLTQPGRDAKFAQEGDEFVRGRAARQHRRYEPGYAPARPGRRPGRPGRLDLRRSRQVPAGLVPDRGVQVAPVQLEDRRAGVGKLVEHAGHEGVASRLKGHAASSLGACGGGRRAR
jgi:hypothetical protein